MNEQEQLDTALNRSIAQMKATRGYIEPPDEPEYLRCVNCGRQGLRDEMVKPEWRKGHNKLCPDCFTRLSMKRK